MAKVSSVELSKDGRICQDCAFIGRNRTLTTRRATFMHLLWHRDSGHLVEKKLIDQYDPELDPLNLPTRDPGKKGRDGRGETARNSAGFPSGSYGDTPWQDVQPEKAGRVNRA